MSDDKLRDSLEDLFSDFSPPGPDENLDASSLLPTPAEELPLELKKDGSEEEVASQEISSSAGDLRAWRQQLIRGMLRALIVVGLLALVSGSYNAYANQEIWLIPFYVGAYGVLVLITLWQRVPHALQSGTILGLVYILGVLGLVEAGLSGDGRVFLLIFPFLVALFFGQREGILALILTFLTLVAFGWAFSTGRILIPVEKQANSADPTAWMSGTIVFLMLSTLLVISQNYLIPRIAGALTHSLDLAQELKAHQARLEDQVAKQTRALQEANYTLQRRAIQLEASVEVGRAIISIFDVGELLRKTVDLIRDRFGFYHAGIFLMDDAGEWAILREATGEAGAQMKIQGHRLAVDDTSMVGWTAIHRQPRIALYAGEDAVRFANPLLPHTRSEMTLPLVVGDQLLGVLNVQSIEEAAFDEDDVRALQSMADQVAVAIENARRVSDEAALLEAASPIYRASHRLTTATATNEVANAIIASIAETGADGCLVVEFEFSSAGKPEALLYRGVWRRDQEPEFRPGTRLPITESPFPLEIVSTLWTVTDVEQDERLPQSARQVFIATGVRALANIPLRARDKVIGQVVVLRTASGPFSSTALRLYEALSDQAAVALERAQLLEETQRRVEQEQLARQMIDHIRRAVNIEQALQTTVKELSQAMRVPHVSIELSIEDNTGA